MKEDKYAVCKDEAGILVPVIDLNACEGKGPCIDVCPYNVLEMQALKDEGYKQLSFFGKLKTAVHGRDKAVVVKPDLCHSCGLCVTSCPEKAIKLRRREPTT